MLYFPAVPDAPQLEICAEIFCSYSHAKKDEALRVEFEKSLSPWVRKKVLQLWHDGRNSAGDNWAENIDENLNRADIIVFLVSPDFLASDYCYEKEMGRAFEREKQDHTVLVPIIVRECSWKETPLADLQAIPAGAKPVTRWRPRDLAWKDVAESLALRAREVLTGKLQIVQIAQMRNEAKNVYAQILQDQQKAQKIYAQIARDATAHSEERQRIMADLQSKIFAIDQELGPSQSAAKKSAKDAFNNIDKYIRGD